MRHHRSYRIGLCHDQHRRSHQSSGPRINRRALHVGNRAFTTQVGSGPFRIEDVPLYNGTGEAEILIKGRDGSEERRTVSFFTSQHLIKKGMADYSVEVGFAREGYGTDSNSYGDDPVLSGSLRYGATEKITFFGHVEAKSDLLMAGLGFAAVPISLGEVTLTIGASNYQGNDAAFINGSERGFADLAYATGVGFLGAVQVFRGSLLEFPEELDVFSMAIPVTRDGRKLGVSFVNSRRANSTDRIVSASFGHSFNNGRGSLNLSASHNITADETRLSVGFSTPLGKRRHARTSVTRDAVGSTTVSAAVSRSMSERVGDYGYHVQLDSHHDRNNLRARGDYRSRFAQFSLEGQQSDDNTYFRGQVDGALVYSGGTFTAGNTINDSFAMVDVGLRDVPVFLQNREVTRTGRSGRALIPGLSSFRRNRVSINVADLPEEAGVGVTAMDVIPSRRAGNDIDFNGNVTESVLVILRRADDSYVPAGSTVRLNGDPEEFVVGYDGMAYLENIKPRNSIKVDTGTGTCTASFGYSSGDSVQDMVEGVVCK